MTLKAELELRPDADKAEVSNNNRGTIEARAASAGTYPNKLNKPAVQSTTHLAVPQFSARQLYFTVGLYGILLSSALWASINVLNWVWHKLL